MLGGGEVGQCRRLAKKLEWGCPSHRKRRKLNRTDELPENLEERL